MQSNSLSYFLKNVIVWINGYTCVSTHDAVVVQDKGEWNGIHLWIQAGLWQSVTQIRGFWTHLCFHINTTYALIIIYTTTFWGLTIWIPISILIIFKEDWQSSLVKVTLIIHLKCWFPHISYFHRDERIILHFEYPWTKHMWLMF